MPFAPGARRIFAPIFILPRPCREGSGIFDKGEELPVFLDGE